jgi:chaperonin cofactor prefoldin
MINIIIDNDGKCVLIDGVAIGGVDKKDIRNYINNKTKKYELKIKKLERQREYFMEELDKLERESNEHSQFNNKRTRGGFKDYMGD